MGAGEESTPTKSSKPASSAQETPITPTTPAYPDWSSSMQAFYGAGATPPFFASTVASPTPHPYLWGSQHPLMPPYGTPVPYPALYPPGGVYAHPNMATAPSAVHGTGELDGKATEGKDRASSKKTKGASGNHVMIVGKTGDGGKAASGSGNDVGTQSAESGSEGSSDASDDNNNQESSATKKGSFDQMLADGANAQNNGVPTNFQTSVPGNPVVSVPATNLNIGMDLWNASPAGSGAMKLRPNQPGVSPTIAPPGMINDQWIQDERELKRQKRKQSNRESARRSRLRKQAECEELQHRVETLSNENHTLRDELQRLSEECEKLTSENNSIKEELTKLCGPDILSKLENSNGTHPQSRGDEGNC
ncbi:G-box-binding factor 1-like isoform X1 [Sesamum indicum]|uniref:G-box-binding factor 1-like isoform X1 n=2 Tax=Sesamum indicum TaxID=4182 RepID=A0A6I9UFQ9_SESIN|nr:G-box-binding factor 1-like isoform X1 [Sesamum indicum]